MEAAADLFGEIERAGQLFDNSWKVKQNDYLDQRTSHIYNCRGLRNLLEFALEKALTDEEQLYAVHRWRNYKRHEAWLSLLLERVPSISLSEQAYDKHQDFYISADGVQIPFDLKITRYPHSAGLGLNDRELAEWFYKNQSRQGRFHLANRFFIVGHPEAALYDLDLASKTIKIFEQNMSRFRHFITHENGQTSRAIILRQSKS